MADINPSSVQAEDAIRYDAPGADVTSGKLLRTQRLQLKSYFFADIDDNDDVLVNVRGALAVAWQANGVADIAAVGIGSATSVVFQTGATNPDGWIHVLTNGSMAMTGSNDETPIAKGTSGYVPHGSIFLNHVSATPNTLTQARIRSTAGLRFQRFPFTIDADGDIWKCTTGTRGTDTLCPGVVAVAWQANTAADTTDAAAATLNANGDVVFNVGSGGETGHLWVWRVR